jgi:hypothetical protein
MPERMQLTDWRNQPIEFAKSIGGVLAVANPWNNVISTGVRPWPAPELIQKVYQSRQTRAFVNDEHAIVTSELGFYSDLQSLHSEDAITWSVFGPVVYSASAIRIAFVRELLALIEVDGSDNNAHVWLWRRLPHPDTLVPGGPEIDFGIQTDNVFLLGEAKWRSSVRVAQGVNRDKDQLTLRREFCQKYGPRLLVGIRHFVVLGVSWKAEMIPRADAQEGKVSLHVRSTTWDAIARIASHPCAEELSQYLRWKAEHSAE